MRLYQLANDTEMYGDTASHWLVVSNDLNDEIAGPFATQAEAEQALRDYSKGQCQWFALCENPATRFRCHPVLGAVPICDRCYDKMLRIETNQKDQDNANQD